MALGQVLLAKKLLSEDHLQRALDRQKVGGGLLGDNLVALGFITRQELEATLQEPPAVPDSISDTGLDSQLLVNSILKAIYVSGLQTIPEISKRLKLTPGILQALFQAAQKEGLVGVDSASDGNYTILKYALTSKGKERAIEAHQQSQYLGPLPVPFSSYQAQVQKQSVSNERINADTLSQKLSHLILPKGLLRQLGPAVNSGRAMLLYGPSGNGKTAIAEAIGEMFQQAVYIPYCVELDGQIIKVFDPAFHREVPGESNSSGQDRAPITFQSANVDLRWVRCRRPFVITGGELTLEMLNLKFDPISKYYEAPLQAKATGGVFVIDDFGRQLVRPEDLINRWIISLEKKVDYLSLHTGKKFELACDQLVIFSTNLSPNELRDTAFLRRIPYKVHVEPPRAEDYAAIFTRICNIYKLELPGEVLSYLLGEYYPKGKTPIASFHPRFIVDYVIAASRYRGVPPCLTLSLVKESVENMVVREPSLSERSEIGRQREGNLEGCDAKEFRVLNADT